MHGLWLLLLCGSRVVPHTRILIFAVLLLAKVSSHVIFPFISVFHIPLCCHGSRTLTKQCWWSQAIEMGWDCDDTGGKNLMLCTDLGTERVQRQCPSLHFLGITVCSSQFCWLTVLLREIKLFAASPFADFSIQNKITTVVVKYLCEQRNCHHCCCHYCGHCCQCSAAAAFAATTLMPSLPPPLLAPLLLLLVSPLPLPLLSSLLYTYIFYVIYVVAFKIVISGGRFSLFADLSDSQGEGGVQYITPHK